jgi:glyoxylase-like metal-dependent hydrolase (beta-lactamase superfamily II)
VWRFDRKCRTGLLVTGLLLMAVLAGVFGADPRLPGRDADIRRAVAQLAGDKANIRFVLNTHFHADHAGNNASFAGTGATINCARECSPQAFHGTIQ